MGIWNSHTSVGNILGTIIPSFWANTDTPNPPWGWSFIVPAFIIGGMGVIVFLFLVVGENTCTCSYMWQERIHVVTAREG